MKARLAGLMLALVCVGRGAEEPSPLKVRLTWGEGAQNSSAWYIRLNPAPGLRVENEKALGLESSEGRSDGAWQSKAGGGDVDGIEFTLSAPEPDEDKLQNVQVIWTDLISGADPDTARRLSQDAAMHPSSPRLTIQMNAEGTRGFTVTMRQLRAEKAIWIPSLNVFISTGDQPVSLAQHREQLKAWAGRRILDQVARQPEASYRQYTDLWEDMGHPSYMNPEQRGPGHIVGITWDSAIPKFGIDRGAGVWNDYGNPDQFQFWFDFGDLKKGITNTWKGQRLENGLPVITTTFEKEGTRYEVEQFAYPLDGPPAERRGDIRMVLMQKLRVTDLTGKARVVPIAFSHRRKLAAHVANRLLLEQQGGTSVLREAGYGRALLAFSGPLQDLNWNGTTDYQRDLKRVDATFSTALAAKGTQEFVFRLASPLVAADDVSKLVALDYSRAKAETVRYWTAYLERGARFRVPDQAVNDLYNASLWHALRLPRRHGGEGPNVTIDLPYSNFAYSQTGTPWPVNQAVYVDYMLYDLRGYHGISVDELAAQYRNNQERDGHVNGYANWVVYTPAMLYSVAQNYLLSHDRAALDKLMPASMKALDWCLRQAQKAEAITGDAQGLVNGPLNDLTGEGVWAFNQAYIYAGLDLFGRVLEETGSPRAAEVRAAAGKMKEAIARGWGAATMRSPIVQLRDHTWQPYVPVEVHTPRRLFEQWYPTDVDTGAVHMSRLKALPPGSPLTDWLLQDHEDNLFYRGLGIANEPVYNQHATAYLLQDKPEAAIRTFYSLMASGFSHSLLEPVEHRWTHGQYFGPPSTDGAWFELYRNMLIHERDDNSLVLGLAAPRAWLADGKKVEVEKAPTYYGPLSMTISSQAASGRITSVIQMAQRSRPAQMLVRLRHPQGKRLTAVTVNGQAWKDFDPAKEWVRIPTPDQARYEIVATY